MKPTEKKIYNLIQNLNDKTRPELDQKILDDCCTELSNHKSSVSVPRLNIWSIVMKHKITKFAAAIIMLAIVLFLTIFEKSVSKAYAIEQALQAIQKTNWLHAIVEIHGLQDTGHSENWIDFKKSITIDKEINGNIRFEDGTNEALYLYNSEANIITISSMSDQYAMPRRTPLPTSPVEVLEQMIANLKKEGKSQVTATKNTVEDRIIETIHVTTQYEVDKSPAIMQETTITVDAGTHLPQNIHMVASSDGKILGSAAIELDYPANGPANIYAAGAAIDAKIIDRRPGAGGHAEITINYKTMADMEDVNREILILYGDFNIDLVKIPSGEFLMGAAGDEIGYPERLLKSYRKAKEERVRNLRHPSDEDPQHLVKIDHGVYMSKYEITCGQFRIFKNQYRKMPHFVGDIGGKMVKCQMDEDDQPAGVSLKDARAFCEWLSKKTGLNVRLACEAEWEYACRAGTKTRFFWGDSEQDAGKYANLSDKSYEEASPRSTYPLDTDDGYVGPAPVGQYLPNAFGLYDMLGNNPEWADGIYSNNAYSIDPNGKMFVNTESESIVKGGSWQVGSLIEGRCASRSCLKDYDMMGSRDSYVGFRIVIDEP